MKILLDENLNLRLRPFLPSGVDLHSVHSMGWDSKSNGELLRLAAAESFDILITLDRNMTAQQNLQNLPLAIIALAPAKQGLPAVAELLSTQVTALLAQGVEKRVYRVSQDGSRTTD